MPVALVTGGAIRVGKAISLGLADAGYDVVVHFNSSADAAGEVVGSIHRRGRRAVAIGADLVRLDEVQRLVGDAEAALGAVDVLVNNASVFPPERLDEVTGDLWDLTFGINLRAPFFLTQAVAPRMKARGHGVIVNVADLAGLQPWNGYVAHGISKAGLVHLTRVAARALAPEIRVVGIAPGTVLPPDDMPADEVERLARRIPLGHIGSPDDVVQAVLYLLNAPFVTGEILTVDGGRMVGRSEK
jgi:pteridine reductase